MLDWVKKCHEGVTSPCFSFHPSSSTCWASLLELRASGAPVLVMLLTSFPISQDFWVGNACMMVTGCKAYGEELHLEVL